MTDPILAATSASPVRFVVQDGVAEIVLHEPPSNVLKISTMEALTPAVREAAGENLERVWLFDAYRGERILPKKISYGFRLVLRAPDRTLTEAEIEGAVSAAREVLTGMGGNLRGGS